jgi:hypothetical protein
MNNSRVAGVVTRQAEATKTTLGYVSIATEVQGVMIEPTVTQNGALYVVQHKIPKQRSGVLRRFSFISWRQQRADSKPEIRGNIFRWPRIQWQA